MKNIHHRKDKYHGGKSTKRNLIYVRKNYHQMFHQLFSKNGVPMTPQEIAGELNNVWCDPDIKFIVVKR